MKIKLKQSIIVRTDLEMGKGKLLTLLFRLHLPDWCNEWLFGESMRTKIILKAYSEVKLYQISTEAVSQGIKYPAEIYDAGKIRTART